MLQLHHDVLTDKQAVLNQLVEAYYDAQETNMSNSSSSSSSSSITTDMLNANNITLPEAAEIILFTIPADEMSYYLDACDRHLALILSLMMYHITNTIMEHMDEHMDEEF